MLWCRYLSILQTQGKERCVCVCVCVCLCRYACVDDDVYIYM